VPLPLPGESESETVKRLQTLVDKYARLFLVSHNAEKVDPNGSVEAWLRAHAAAANDQWAGSVRVTPFVPVADAGAPVAELETASWASGPTLALASVQPGGQVLTPTAGSALAVTLQWENADETSDGATPRKASLQLLGPDGALAAQEDREVVAGEETFVLLIPRSAAPGDYRLVLVVYDPATGQRFATVAGAELAELGTVAIGPAPAPAPVELPPLRHPDDAADEGS
jgi:hypothetical protein